MFLTIFVGPEAPSGVQPWFVARDPGFLACGSGTFRSRSPSRRPQPFRKQIRLRNSYRQCEGRGRHVSERAATETSGGRQNPK